MRQLMRKLLRIRVRPYYLHHADPVKSTAHFRTSIETGLAIMKSLRGNIPGIGVPHYMVDLPGGEGKVPLLPDYLKEMTEQELTLENHRGKICRYPLA